MAEDLIYISNSKRNQKAGHTINNVFSRSGAIERMAKASCELFVGNDWEQMTEQQKEPFIKEAEIMLKALIEECEGW